jgi:hypothetical protein
MSGTLYGDPARRLDGFLMIAWYSHGLMRGRFRRARRLPLAIASLGLLCAVAWASARETTAMPLSAPLQPFPVPRTLPRVVSDALTHSDRRIVTVVAADIDADGDLDVVASDGSLDLLVWTNDGGGHFTRRRPARSSGWRDTSPGPTYDSRNPSVQCFTHDTLPSLDSDQAICVASLDAARLADPGRTPAHESRRPAGPPRAPPLPLA